MNFLETQRLSTRQLVHPKMAYTSQRIQTNVSKAKEYFQGISRYVSNDHVIMRLCRMLLTRFDISTLDRHDPYVLVMELNDFAESNSTLLGIGTDYKRGALQEVFYDRDYLFFKELESPIDVTDWTALEPIKVMTHPRTDVSYSYPLPIDCELERGIASMEIDLSALLMMLKGYYTQYDTEKLDYALFLSRYVFPSMIPSHVDVSFFNRIRASVVSAPKAPQIKINGLTLPDIYSFIDTVTEDLAARFVKERFNINDLLKNIPLIYHDTAFDKYKYNGEAPTSTGRVYVLLSRYRLLSTLLDLIEEKPDSSKLELNDLAKFMRTVISFNSLKQLNILNSEEEILNAELIVPLINHGFKLKLL